MFSLTKQIALCFTIAFTLIFTLNTGAQEATAIDDAFSEDNGMIEYTYAVSLYNNGDYSSALSYFLKAGDKNYQNAMVYLGDMYALGQGTDQDFESAVKWYVRFCENSNGTGTSAIYLNVGLLYYNGGFGLAQDRALAYKYIKMAADIGSETAKEKLALF